MEKYVSWGTCIVNECRQDCQLPDNETKEVKGKVGQEEYPKELTG